MKKLLTKGLLIVTAALLLNSCQKEIQNLFENELVFNLDANAYLQNQVQLQFVNANSSKSRTIPRPAIRITGKDALTVYDINGSRNIAVTSQFANLAVSPGKPLSPSAPAIFKIEASAPGFLPFEQEIEVTHLDSFLTYTFEMVEINNPPIGINISSTSVDLTAKKAIAIGQPKSGRFQEKYRSMPTLIF